MRHLLFAAGIFLSGFSVGCGQDSPSTSPDLGMSGSEDMALPMIGPVLEPGDPGTADVRFTVRADGKLRPISPLIYGTNGTPTLATTKQSVARSGGNRMTAYNWENNASNAGSDYQYQNDGYLTASNVPGEAVRPLIEEARNAGAAVLLTVPIVDYVAADKNGGGDIRGTPNYQQTRLKQNKPQKGSALSTTPDSNDYFVYQDEFVSWAKTNFPTAQILYSLDNEPDLWSSTHPEVHPTAVGYDELCQRNVSFATAVKAVVPDAKVTGFVSYGFNGYVSLQDAPDRGGKGEFIDYYLSRMAAAEQAAGKRLVDYLDLHWYPEAMGDGRRITDTGVTAGEVEARVQAPRSLWDDTYVENSWITGYLGNKPVNLLPWLQGKIDSKYAGTQLAFTEWNYGGGQHISGAIATADVLGIFGRDGVGLATIWPLNTDERYTYAGLQMYRNFDGAAGRFGNVSISATSSDRAAASVYASLDSSAPSRVVLVAINKRTQPLRAGITVAHPTQFTRADIYTLTSSAPAPMPAAPITTVAQNAWNYNMPPQSVSVLVLKP